MARSGKKLSDKQRRLLGVLGILGGGVGARAASGLSTRAFAGGKLKRGLLITAGGSAGAIGAAAFGERKLFSKRDKGIQKHTKSRKGRAVAGFLTGGPVGAALGAFGNRTFTGAKINHSRPALFGRNKKYGSAAKRRKKVSKRGGR